MAEERSTSGTTNSSSSEPEVTASAIPERTSRQVSSSRYEDNDGRQVRRRRDAEDDDNEPVEERYVVLHVILGRRQRPLTPEEIALLPDLPGQMKPTAISQEPFVRGDTVPRQELTDRTDGYDNIARLEALGAIVGSNDATSAARRQVAADTIRWGRPEDRENAIIVKKVELEGDRSLALANRRRQLAEERRQLEIR